MPWRGGMRPFRPRSSDELRDRKSSGAAHPLHTIAEVAERPVGTVPKSCPTHDPLALKPAGSGAISGLVTPVGEWGSGEQAGSGSFSPLASLIGNAFQETWKCGLLSPARRDHHGCAGGLLWVLPMRRRRSFSAAFDGSFSGGGTVMRSGGHEPGDLHFDRPAFRFRHLDQWAMRDRRLLEADLRRSPFRSRSRSATAAPMSARRSGPQTSRAGGAVTRSC